ncbi:hypothetical protein FA95DRAFT_911904 [Auriscalpium vulgare]|uniref:Uncharacterized protein n=1 Tax=Auriscalpium vulgare TaxID=40419 RepID=A0ACB8R812_9AGAM|nr:hypothetical protein FA95DRAFT_911904 [Auriscalpium vulgare]
MMSDQDTLCACSDSAFAIPAHIPQRFPDSPRPTSQMGHHDASVEITTPVESGAQLPYTRTRDPIANEVKKKRKRAKRKRADKFQLEMLMKAFQSNAKPPTVERVELAKKLDMSAHSVYHWCGPIFPADYCNPLEA